MEKTQVESFDILKLLLTQTISNFLFHNGDGGGGGGGHPVSVF